MQSVSRNTLQNIRIITLIDAFLAKFFISQKTKANNWKSSEILGLHGDLQVDRSMISSPDEKLKKSSFRKSSFARVPRNITSNSRDVAHKFVIWNMHIRFGYLRSEYCLVSLMQQTFRVSRSTMPYFIDVIYIPCEYSYDIFFTDVKCISFA